MAFELEKKQVIAISGMHAPSINMVKLDEVQRETIRLKAKMIGIVADALGIENIFFEGLSESLARNTQEFMRRFNLEEITSIGEQHLNDGRQNHWEQALQAAQMKPRNLTPHPTEIDQRSAQCFINIMQYKLTADDVDFIVGFIAEKANITLDAAQLTFFLIKENTETLYNLIKEIRISYADKEMAKNINIYGGQKNILVVGGEHRLEGFDEIFHFCRINIDIVLNRRILQIVGNPPQRLMEKLEELAKTMSDGNGRSI